MDERETVIILVDHGEGCIVLYSSIYNSVPLQLQAHRGLHLLYKGAIL